MIKKLKIICLCVGILFVSGCQSQNTDKAGVIAGIGNVTLRGPIKIIEQQIGVVEDTDAVDDSGEESKNVSTEGNKKSSSTKNSVGENVAADDNRSRDSSTPVVESVTISIECKTILKNMDKLESGYKEYVPSGGIFIASMPIEITGGESVLDILHTACNTSNISVVVSGGSYIESIGNIKEKKCGEFSGWMYSINDAYISNSVSRQKVKSGDTIKIMFSCAPNGKDLYFK